MLAVVGVHVVHGALQALLVPFPLRGHRFGRFAFLAAEQQPDLAKQNFYLQMIQYRVLRVQRHNGPQCFAHGLPAGSLRGLDQGQAAGAAFQHRLKGLLIHRTVRTAAEELRVPYKGVQLAVPLLHRVDLVQHTPVDEYQFAGVQMHRAPLHLAEELALDDPGDLNFLVPVPADVTVFEVREVVQIHAHREIHGAVHLSLPQRTVYQRFVRFDLFHFPPPVQILCLVHF